MLPVSSKFLATVRGSHGIVSRARVITPGATGADPPGVDLVVIDGGVTLDGSADVRGSLTSLEVYAPFPTAWTTADLVPYGTEIAVSRGVVYGNGAVERAPLGIYRIQSVEQADAPAGTLTIGGQDRMSGLIEADLLAPRQFIAGTTLGAVVSNLVTEVYPAAVIEWDDATNLQTLTRAAIVEEDRFAFLQELVTARGKVMYYDYRGVLVIRTPPNPTTSVFTVDAGATGVLVKVSRSLTRDGVFNAVVATGESADDFAPARGVATDDDPTSPTYWNGSFGKVPKPFASPLIYSNAQALTVAKAMLAQATGLPYSVDFSAVPNPALEPLDPVEVVYPRVNVGASAAREIHVLDQITIPLASGGALGAKTRLQRRGVSV